MTARQIDPVTGMCRCVTCSSVEAALDADLAAHDLFRCSRCSHVRQWPPAGYGDYAPDGNGDPLCQDCARAVMLCPEYAEYVTDGGAPPNKEDGR